MYCNAPARPVLRAAIQQQASFYKAAEILNYSQPTISMRMKQLEQDLGVLLFERGKSLQLTKAGKLAFIVYTIKHTLIFD